MALNESVKYSYDGFNTALEDATSFVSGFFQPKPQNLDQYVKDSGIGIQQFPKGSGVEINGSAPMRPNPERAKRAAGTNNATQFDNATRRLVIPRGASYAGVAPEAIGIAPSGSIILASIQDERARFGSNNNASGWATAVASYKSLDSGAYAVRKTAIPDQQVLKDAVDKTTV